MDNNFLRVFENKELGKVRTLIINNEPWFVGKDVAEILGYTNPSKALLAMLIKRTSSIINRY